MSLWYSCSRVLSRLSRLSVTYSYAGLPLISESLALSWCYATNVLAYLLKPDFNISDLSSDLNICEAWNHMRLRYARGAIASITILGTAVFNAKPARSRYVPLILQITLRHHVGCSPFLLQVRRSKTQLPKLHSEKRAVYLRQ